MDTQRLKQPLAEAREQVEQTIAKGAAKIDPERERMLNLQEMKERSKNPDGRLTSSFGVAIATGLTLESVHPCTHLRYDDTRVIPNRIDVTNYDVFAINVMTIAKNVINSVSPKAEDFMKVIEDKNFERWILEDLTAIDGLFLYRDGWMVFYLPDYNYIASKLNHGKVDTMTKVLSNNSLLYKKLSGMKLKFDPPIKARGDRFYRLNFKSKDRVLMYTSFPHDLLNHGNIHLLENHTGLLVKPNMFNKKYKPIGTDKHFNMLPFDEMLLYLLGDNTTSMLCNYGEKVRKEIYNLAIQEKWTPNTSILRIHSTLRRNPFILGNMNNFNRLY